MFVRPPAFEYKDRKLYCERIPLDQLAEKYGTPLYVYSATAIQDRFSIFDTAFEGVPHTICYSVKANSNLSILRLLAKLGAGFDIVSGGELERVRLADKKTLSKVVFSGVGKTADELALALRAGILLFNVESEGELELLAECAGKLRTTANVALRVNPDVPAETHPYISTGLHEHKFGVPIDTARGLYRRAAAHKYLKVAGVSLHLGSQITDVSPFAIADAAMNDLLRPALYGARHEITPVALEEAIIQTDVVGPVCESGDFLARDVTLPALGSGEYLCVLDAGAYGMALASNYNTRPRAAEVLVDGARARVIRRRETLKQILHPETACL